MDENTMVAIIDYVRKRKEGRSRSDVTICQAIEGTHSDLTKEEIFIAEKAYELSKEVNE